MKISQKLVSIIVPVYGVEKFISKCLDSLLSQTYSELEIVLVDDGSKDNSGKICDEYAKKDKRIKVIHKENGGVMSAWTEGVKASTGEYIAFSDPDDTMSEHAISKFMNALTENDADMVLCGFNVIFANSSQKRSSNIDDITGVLQGEELAKFKLNSVNKINSYAPLYKWNKFFKRELVLNNLKYCNLKVSLGDDCCIALGSILDSQKIVILDDALYNYFQRGKSIIHSYNTKLFEMGNILLGEITRMLKDKNFYTEESHQFEQARILFVVTKNLMTSSLKKKEKKKIFQELVCSDMAKDVKAYGGKNNFEKKHQLFLKVFFTGSYFLTHFALKVFMFLKESRQKTIKE